MAHELVETLLLERARRSRGQRSRSRELARQPRAGGEVSQPPSLIRDCHRRHRSCGPARARSSRNKRPIRSPSRSSTSSGRISRSSESPSCIAYRATSELARVVRQLVAVILGVALERRHERFLRARVDLSEACAQRRPAHDSAPRTRRTPRASRRRARAAAPPRASAPRTRFRRWRRHAAISRSYSAIATLRAALVDGEEDVLLRREVRVDRALGVARRLRDLSSDVAWKPCSTKSRSAAATAPCGSVRSSRLASFAYRQYLYTDGIRNASQRTKTFTGRE